MTNRRFAKLFGGPPLAVQPDKEASSYWVARTELAQPRERFECNLFACIFCDTVAQGFSPASKWQS